MMVEGPLRATPVRERTRREILVQALRLFAERGYDATSLQDIATAVGCSKGVVFYHFSGKRALYSEVIAPGVEALRALVAEASGLPPDRAQQAATAGLVALLVEHRSIVAVLPVLTARPFDLEELAELNELGDSLLRLLARSEDPHELALVEFALSGMFTLTRAPELAPDSDLSDILLTALNRLLRPTTSPDTATP